MSEIIKRLTRLARNFASSETSLHNVFLGQGYSHGVESLDEELQRLESDAPLSSAEKHSPLQTTIKHEIVVYTQYMMPLLLNQAVYRYCLVFAPIQAMGKLDGTHLAAGSLANATLNVCVFSVIYGMGGSLDTLATQAHGAQTKRDLNLLYSLRVTLCICISYTALVPFICFFPFALLGVEADAAELARSYMRWALLGLPGFVGYECVRKYTQAMGRMSGPMVATLSAAPFMLLLLRSNVAGEHTPPLALATFLNLSFAAVSFWAYLVLPRSTWQDFPTFKEVSTDLKIVFKIGSANVISTCSDWFAWEYLSFLSAWQGNLILSGNAVLITSAFTFYTLPSALSNGVPSRIGNWVGRNRPREAKLSAYVAIWYAVAIGTAGGLLIFLMRKPWVALFTTDPEISALVSRVMPYFCAIVALDAWQGCWMAILRGAGLPIQIAHAMLLGHYAVGLPAATVFALLFHWDLLGLWSGFALGLSVVSWRLYILIARVDWIRQAEAAQTHVDNTSKALEQSRPGQDSLEVRLDELALEEIWPGESAAYRQ